MDEIKITDKQEKFIERYLIHLNATKAAIEAGYSKESAQQIGSENLSKPVIQEGLARAKEKRAKSCEIEAADVLKVLKAVMVTNTSDLYTVDADGYLIPRPLDELSESANIALSEVKQTRVKNKSGEELVNQTFRTWDKLKAAELAGKHLGMYKDGKEISFAGNNPFKSNCQITFVSAKKEESNPDG